MTTGPFFVDYKSLAPTVAILDKVSPTETPIARIGEGSSTLSLSTSLSPSPAPPMQPSPQKIYSGVVVAIVLAVLVGVVGIIILFLVLSRRRAHKRSLIMPIELERPSLDLLGTTTEPRSRRNVFAWRRLARSIPASTTTRTSVIFTSVFAPTNAASQQSARSAR